VVERILGLVHQQAAGHPVGVDKKPDFGATTAVNLVWEKAKQKITPKVLWSAVGILVGALTGSITWLVHTNSNMDRLTEKVAESNKSVADMQQKLDLLQDIKTQIAVMGGKVDTIADEVDRQRERWERIEGIAESPPHARRRH
jgi:K+-sensing histidine kinase KdpD